MAILLRTIPAAQIRDANRGTVTIDDMSKLSLPVQNGRIRVPWLLSMRGEPVIGHQLEALPVSFFLIGTNPFAPPRDNRLQLHQIGPAPSKRFFAGFADVQASFALV